MSLVSTPADDSPSGRSNLALGSLSPQRGGSLSGSPCGRFGRRFRGWFHTCTEELGDLLLHQAPELAALPPPVQDCGLQVAGRDVALLDLLQRADADPQRVR